MTTEEKNTEIKKMKRVWSVCCDPLFQKYLDLIRIKEEDRIYCCHGWDHLLSTARIAYILDLERNLCIPKDIIYTMAVLHDLGRAKEYEDGTPHDQAGAEIAQEILSGHEFSKEEIRLISGAIAGHRGDHVDNMVNRESNGNKDSSYGTDIGDTVNNVNIILETILREADNLSRECYRCKAADTCKWSEDRKNNSVIY